MSKFEDNFRGSFDISKNNPDGVKGSKDLRSLKRCHQDALTNNSEVLLQSQTPESVKKAKTMREPCNVSAKASL
jgi:hypothetical protein